MAAFAVVGPSPSARSGRPLHAPLSASRLSMRRSVAGTLSRCACVRLSRACAPFQLVRLVHALERAPERAVYPLPVPHIPAVAVVIGQDRLAERDRLGHLRAPRS